MTPSNTPTPDPDQAGVNPSAPVVELHGVVCSAGPRRLLEISRLQIHAGERVAILGHNGAGKSTLLRLLGGMLLAQHGQVQVLGQDLHASLPAPTLRALRRQVGQLMQGLHLVTRLSARENVLIGALGRSQGWKTQLGSWLRWFPADQVQQANAALQAVGMLARASARADQLSGGERQKVAIARLLMQRPQLVLADEPTAALDPAAAADVCQLLAQAVRGATLISVVHNPALLPLLADRVIGLKNGLLVFDMPLAELSDDTLINLYRPDDGSASSQIPSCANGQLLTSVGEP